MGTMTRLRRLLADRRGVSAVEFALVSPLLLMIVAFTLDFGSALYARFQLDQSVTASATYGLVNAELITTDSATLANRLATIASANRADVSAAVVVNSGPTATASEGMVTGGGTADPAQSCYCPNLSGAAIAWGNPVACGNPCPDGAPAGRYITISASRAYTPLFAGYGVIDSGTIVASAVVRAQ